MRYATIRRLAEAREGVLVTLVAREGHAYKPAGACALYASGGDEPAWGNLGGTCIDAAVAPVAREVLADGRPRFVTVDSTDPDDAIVGTGTACGGRMVLRIERLDATRAAYFERLRDRLEAGETVEVEHALPDGGAWTERVEPPAPLVVFGATPLARRVVELVEDLDVCVTLADWRRERVERLAGRAGRGGVRTAGEDFAVDARTLVLVLSHQTERDVAAARRALEGDARWVGILASRARRDVVMRALAESGVGADALARVVSPVGLDVGARTDAEIAVAIVAQIIRVLRGNE